MLTTRHTPRPFRRRLAMLAAVASAVCAAPTLADSWTWNNFAGGNINWRVADNWTPAAIPVSAVTTELTFGATGDQQYTAVQNISNPFILNRLNFTTTSSLPITVGSATNDATAATIRFAGTNPTVTHSGSGDVVFNPRLVLAADTSFNVTGAGKLIVLGNYTQTGGDFGLSKTGPGVMQWGDASRGIGNSLAGEIKVQEGSIVLGSAAGSFISADSLVTIAAGASFDFAGNAEDFGSLQGEGTLHTNGANINVGQDDRSVTWAGVITGSSGANYVGKQGAGNWTLTNANTYLGETRITAGSMTFAGANGSAQSSNSVTLAAGTSLTLDNTDGKNDDRINDASPITVAGNTQITLLGSASTDTSETLGGLTANGATTISVRPGAGRAARLTFGGLTRSTGATILFRGDNLGATPAAGVAGIVFLGAPVLVGGGGAANSTNMSIIPYALADSSPTGSGDSLVTYDDVVGVRPLSVNTEYAAYAGATPTDNVRVTAAATALPGQAVNSLVVHNPSAAPMAVSGQAGSTLVVTSGALLFTGAGPISLGGFDAVNFDAAEGIVSVAGDAAVTISTPVAGFAGLTKNGSGTLALTAANTYFSGTAINSGTLEITSDANLGEASGQILFNAGRLRVANDLMLPRSIFINTRGVAGFDTNGRTLELSGTVSGAGLLVKEGAGTLKITGLNGNTGGMAVRGGTVEITDGGQLGAGGTVTLDGGGIRLANTATISRPITVGEAGGAIDTNGFDVSTPAITGPGHFEKNGAGILTLTASSGGLTGEWRINAGTLRNGVTSAGAGIDGQGDATTVVVAAGAVFDDSFGNGEIMGGLAGAGDVLMHVGNGYTFNNANQTTRFDGIMKSALDGVPQGAVSFVAKAGTGVWTLGGRNEYQGPTRILDGTLKLATDNALPAPSDTHPGTVLTVGTPGSTSAPNPLAGIFELDGFDQTLAGLVTTPTNTAGAANRVVNSNAAAPSVLTIAAADATTHAFGGTLSGNLSLVKQGPGVQVLSGANTYTGATTVTAGTLDLTGTHTGGGEYTVGGAATTATLAASTLRTGALNVRQNGVVTLRPGTAASVIGNLTFGGEPSSAPQGQLNVNGQLVLTNADLAEVTAQVRSGRNSGAWDGQGITSNAAAADPLDITGVAAVRNEVTDGSPLFSDFGGELVAPGSILLMHTYDGDVDLDRRVGISDYFAMDRGRALRRTGYQNGDLDYSGGPADAADYMLIDRAFLGQGAAALSAGNAAGLSAAATAVPEPTTLACLGTIAFGLLARRRSRAH